MMVASSAVSPLCTWLVAACMSSSSENKHFNEFSNYFQYQKKLRRRGNLVALTTNKNRGRIQLSRARDSDEEKSAVATETLIKSKKRRVVVTGLGVVSPLGHDVDEFYGNILQGISGVTQIEAFDSTQFPTRIAGEIKSFSADGFISKKIAKRADKYMLYLIAAGKKALADGKMRDDVMQELDKGKCGIVIGSALGGMKVFSDGVEALRVSHKKMNPFSVPFATTNMGSAILAMDLGWMGPNYSISAACATSNICILNAANHIIRGETDVMLCGGSDSPLIPIGIGGFSACGILSRGNDEPTKASRPWDMIVGEAPPPRPRRLRHVLVHPPAAKRRRPWPRGLCPGLVVSAHSSAENDAAPTVVACGRGTAGVPGLSLSLNRSPSCRLQRCVVDPLVAAAVGFLYCCGNPTTKSDRRSSKPPIWVK